MAEHLNPDTAMPEGNPETTKTKKSDHAGCCLLTIWGWVLFLIVEAVAFLWVQLIILTGIRQCEIAHGYFTNPSTSGQVYYPSVFVPLPPSACAPFYNASFWSAHLACNGVVTFAFLFLAFCASLIWNMSQGNKPHEAIGHATRKLRLTQAYNPSRPQQD